jgi:DNA methyltransferase 1-associated protein 1
MYDSRFIVVNDRYEEKYKRSIEEIKKRYYEICHKIAQVKD